MSELILYIFIIAGILWPWYSAIYDKYYFEKKNPGIGYDKYHAKAMIEFEKKFPEIKDL